MFLMKIRYFTNDEKNEISDVRDVSPVRPQRLQWLRSRYPTVTDHHALPRPQGRWESEGEATCRLIRVADQNSCWEVIMRRVIMALIETHTTPHLKTTYVRWSVQNHWSSLKEIWDVREWCSS